MKGGRQLDLTATASGAVVVVVVALCTDLLVIHGTSARDGHALVEARGGWYGNAVPADGAHHFRRLVAHRRHGALLCCTQARGCLLLFLVGVSVLFLCWNQYLKALTAFTRGMHVAGVNSGTGERKVPKPPSEGGLDSIR